MEDFLNLILPKRKYERTPSLEKKINEYITLRLVNGRTYIFVNGNMFIQCIRLILNIPKNDVHLYDEVDSIDEAAKLYSKHVWQNMIVRGPMAARVPNQTHDITPEQEFWGHCSNIQAWVEHDYDTRILMSNISFPLLRELTKVGDPKARSVYKEEIALRLESGYPSVVQYLLTQGYLNVFTPEEFKTILETTDLIKKLAAEPNMLSHFLKSCVSKFPTLLEVILLQLLKQPKGKKIFLSSILLKSKVPQFRSYYRSNYQYLNTIKVALEKLKRKTSGEMIVDIRDCIQLINQNLEGQQIDSSYSSRESLRDVLRTLFINDMHLDNLDKELFGLKQKLLNEHKKIQSKCSYCGKVIPKGKETCEWCGHKKDDYEGGFFPYIFKPPGGGGGGMKGTIAVSVAVKSQT